MPRPGTREYDIEIMNDEIIHQCVGAGNSLFTIKAVAVIESQWRWCPICGGELRLRP